LAGGVAATGAGCGGGAAGGDGLDVVQPANSVTTPAVTIADLVMSA